MAGAATITMWVNHGLLKIKFIIIGTFYRTKKKRPQMRLARATTPLPPLLLLVTTHLTIQTVPEMTAMARSLRRRPNRQRRQLEKKTRKRATMNW